MFEILILLLSGTGAGVITGIVSASAVTIMAPILVVLLGYPPYLAIGIALAVDVFSSLAATFIYKRYKRLNIKPSLVLLFFALLATMVGSHVSVDIPSYLLSVASGVGIVLAGVFIYKKKKDNKFKLAEKIVFLKKRKKISLVLIGLWVGTIAGVFGAGGGIMIFAGLTLILDYNTHKAIGTSVFLMIFIALLGGLVHYINMPFSFTALALGGGGGVAGACISSVVANNFKERSLGQLAGVVIAVLGLMLVFKPLLNI